MSETAEPAADGTRTVAELIATFPDAPLDAEVKARVPQFLSSAVDACVTDRRRTGARTFARADVAREALTEYFASRPEIRILAEGYGPGGEE